MLTSSKCDDKFATNNRGIFLQSGVYHCEKFVWLTSSLGNTSTFSSHLGAKQVQVTADGLFPCLDAIETQTYGIPFQTGRNKRLEHVLDPNTNGIIIG